MGSLPTGPWFPREVTFEGTGVDFLGLRAVNMRLIDDCLPGISNVTYNIRCYSVASWGWWKARALLKGGERRDSEDLVAFSDRVETLFAWGHRAYGYTGAPGSGSGPPAGRVVPLDFKSWGRVRRNTSIMAAVRYGPSVKKPNGLGFLESREGGTFAVLPPGKEIAEALDAKLRPLKAYGLLDSLAPVKGRVDDAVELVTAWRVGEVSKREAAAFRSAFHVPGADPKSREGRRTASIDLILHALAQADGPMDVEDIRRSLVSGRLPDGSRLDVPAGLAVVRERWLIMQVRQLQRLALEALLSWAESQMLRHDTRRIPDLRASLSEQMWIATGAPAGSSWGEVVADAVEAFANGEKHPEVALFLVWDQLLEALGADDGEGIIGSAIAAFGCVRSIAEVFVRRGLERAAAVGAEKVDEDPVLASCDFGGIERLSLTVFNEWLAARDDDPAELAVVDLLETHVLSRHLSIGVGRFDGVKQRLRFTLEEEGLGPLVHRPLDPSVTADRLDALLSLMSECGLVVRSDEGGFTIP